MVNEKMKTLKNKKGMEGWLTNLLLGIIVVGGISAGFALFSSELITQYTDQDASEIENLEFMDRARALENATNTMADIMQEEPANLLESGYIMLKGTYKAITTILASMGIFTGLLKDLTNVAGLPDWFTTIIFAGGMLVFVMAIIGWFMKRSG